ncbi:unnamed protein product [Ectocarpus sp. 8 AP-2014]
MAIRSVDEIINLSDSSKNPERLAFKDLVQHIDPRIRECAPRHNRLHFTIPGILWGQPVFNADRVEKMIIRHYNSIGFKCVRLNKREILIRWGEGGEQEGQNDKHDSSDDSAESSDIDSVDSTESSETGTSESTESTDSSDGDDSHENKTKCVTVES